MAGARLQDCSLGNLITYNPWSVSAMTPLADLARMLSEHDFTHWPVVDDDKRLVGVLSDIDIIRALQARNLAAAAVGAAEDAHATAACTAGDIMSARPLTIREDGSPVQAIRLLLDHNIHSLPVLADGRLIGMITSSDFLRELSFGQLPGGRATVSAHLQKPTEPVEPTDSFDDALLAMHRAQTQFIAVAKDGFPLGVISRREITAARCRAEARELSPAGALCAGPTTLGELVRRSPTLRPGQKLSEAAALLLERRLTAAPVVNQAHRLLGIVSEDDILQAIQRGLAFQSA